MKHNEHARMHIKLREQAKKDTIQERKQALKRIIKETIEKEAFE